MRIGVDRRQPQSAVGQFRVGERGQRTGGLVLSFANQHYEMRPLVFGERESRPAEEITLHAVYSAMGERLLIRTESDPGDVTCAIVRSVDRVMTDFLDDAEALLAARLQRVRLSDIAGEAMSKGFPRLD